ncbi:MAG TPA: acyltransferase [Acidobacteriaceae bacterium]|nr:acyltransferase [Acidobacteriaceae bacterium]
MLTTNTHGTQAENNTSPNPLANGTRLLSLQAMRAVAALLVVWAHSLDAAAFFGTPRQSRFFYWENFGASGLDIFFVISGFIVSLVAARAAAQIRSRQKHPARHFLSRRITRIFPLYWILTIVVILESELGRYNVPWRHVHWLPTLFLLPTLHYPPGMPLLWLGWSLVFEMYFYLVLTAFLACTPRSLVRNTAVFLCGMVAVGSVVGIHRPLLALWMNPMLLDFVFGCIVAMLFVRYRNATHAPSPLGRWIAALGAVLLAVTIFTGYGQASEALQIFSGYACWLRVGLWGVPSAILVGGMLFWNPAMRSLPARLLVFLGDASYSIYLCTIPARSVVEHCWNIFGVFGADIGVLLSAIFCAGVGVVCYLLVERPLMRFFHNWYKPIPFRETPA